MHSCQPLPSVSIPAVALRAKHADGVTRLSHLQGPTSLPRLPLKPRQHRRSRTGHAAPREPSDHLIRNTRSRNATVGHAESSLSKGSIRLSSALGAGPLPLPRGRECPFGPAPEVAKIRQQPQLTKVSCPTGIDAWLVTRYDDAREVLSDSQRFSCSSGQAGHVLDIFARDSPVNEGEFFHMDGPDHVRFRQVFAPAISTIKRIELFRPMIRRTVDELLDGLATATEPVDLHERFSKPLTSTVIAELLDVPHEDRALFH